MFGPLRGVGIWLLWLVLAAPLPAAAGTVTVAVASNFLTTAEALAARFEAETGHEVALVHGSTGKLYAQIVAGAPYDVFLSADAARPARLEADGLVARDGRRSYAVGRLALVLNGTPGGTPEAVLTRPGLRVAIADPATAPYGAAAAELLAALRGPDWRGGVVFGESVGQAFAFVATGNAPAGLIALSQTEGRATGLTVLPIPPDRHAPIRQDAVLLARGADTPAAAAFFAFLASPAAVALIEAAGYAVVP